MPNVKTLFYDRRYENVNGSFSAAKTGHLRRRPERMEDSPHECCGLVYRGTSLIKNALQRTLQ